LVVVVVVEGFVVVVVVGVDLVVEACLFTAFAVVHLTG